MVDASITDEDLAHLHANQVRGTRFNFVAHLGGAPNLDEFWTVVHRVAELGWHIVLHLDAKDFSQYDHLLDEMPVPYIIDHMARIPAQDGVDQLPFQQLLERLRTDEKCWVKISCAERLTKGKVAPFDEAILTTAPDRTLWGTDWPHPNMQTMPDEGHLLDLLTQFAPDQTLRDQVLVDNPQMLYDFH